MADGSLARQRSLSEIVRIVTQIKSQHAFLFTAAEFIYCLFTPAAGSPFSFVVMFVELPPCQLSALQAIITRLIKWLCLVQ